MAERGNPHAAVSRHDRPIQRSNRTKIDRHPEIFSCASDVATATGVRHPRILSFGCSTGEEAFTLSTRYFAGSTIVGSDINAAVIAQARETYAGHPNLHFALADDRPLAPQSFDVIFAMNVLCRWPKTRDMDDISQLYPFEAFEEHVAHLDSLLKPGGVLVIHNANYSFLSTQTARGYDLITDPSLARPGMVTRFRSDGRVVPGRAATDCIFLKQDADRQHGRDWLAIRDRHLQPLAVIERAT